MIGSCNYPITGVRLQPTVRLQNKYGLVRLQTGLTILVQFCEPMNNLLACANLV